MITAGLPTPAGKCRSSASCPVTDSGVVVNESVCEMPFARSWVIPNASAISTSVTTAAVGRPCRPMNPATLPQTPCASAASEP